MKIKKFFEQIKNNKIITTTYDKIIPGNDYEDEPDIESGWEDEDGESMIPDEYDIEDGLTVVDKAVEYLKYKRYTTEPSSNMFHPGISYSTPDPDIDYHTGKETYYTSHLDGFTQEEEYEIWKKMTNWEQKQFNKTLKKYNL